MLLMQFVASGYTLRLMAPIPELLLRILVSPSFLCVRDDLIVVQVETNEHRAAADFAVVVPFRRRL
jgi:hypothetical protein